FSVRRVEGLRENNEVMNQAFHVSHDVWLRWRNVLGDISHDRTRRHLFETLLDDPRALAHLFHADPVSIVGVAVLADRHFPFDLVVRAVGFELADIVGYARSA